MNLIYLRPTAPKAKKFIKKKLRSAGRASIYNIEAGDCCLAPVPVKRRDYVLTFLNDISPEMVSFMYVSKLWANLNQN
jgi:hypothetical protein